MDNTSNVLLDRIAQRHGIRSNYGIAKLFKADPSRITNYRLGRSQMDEVVALEAAKLAGEDPAAVLADLQAERSKSPEAKRHWKQLAELARLAARSAAVTVAAVSMLVGASISETQQGRGLQPNQP